MTVTFHSSTSEIKAKELYKVFQIFSRPGVCMKFYVTVVRCYMHLRTSEVHFRHFFVYFIYVSLLRTVLYESIKITAKLKRILSFYSQAGRGTLKFSDSMSLLASRCNFTSVNNHMVVFGTWINISPNCKDAKFDILSTFTSQWAT